MKNQSWRIIVLAVALLGSLGYLIFGSGYDFLPAISSDPNPEKLQGDNRIISVRLVAVDAYSATTEVEYFYNGASGPAAKLQLTIGVTAAEPNQQKDQVRRPEQTIPVRPGRQKVIVRIPRSRPPFDPAIFATPLHTQSIEAQLSSTANVVLARSRSEIAIDWPSSDPFVLSGTSTTEIDRLYRLCVQTIDSGNQLELAKKGLEQILLAKPEYVPAYAELARYQMKTNWSPAGLEQAEQSLKTALRIDPNHANSLVLIGYVYAHQRRFKEADDAFRKAETIGTKNIWLYANWGELHAMEGKQQAAIAMYRKAVDAPKDLETYERARQDAYEHLLVLLENNKQWQDADALYEARIARYPDNGCFKAEYAAFFLDRRGDYNHAIDIGTKALEQNCNDGGINTQMILAKAYYTKWATELSHSANQREADQFFSRGQALYSEMATLMYSLASSQYTAVAIPALKRQGITIDTADRNGVTALGYSILNHDPAAGLTLIRYGANVNQRLNQDGLTPLMVAASQGDRQFVSLLLKHGADRRRKTMSGYSAERIAVERGFGDIANMISGRSGL